MKTIEAQIQEILDRQALKDLVDTFSNLADEKRVAEQMPLFTEDAQVTTYMNGQLFADMTGRVQIAEVFNSFLSGFHTVYHLNGQHTVQLSGDQASGINYCHVILVGEQNGKNIIHNHGVRYQDHYVKQDGQWLIKKRIARFMVSDSRELGVI